MGSKPATWPVWAFPRRSSSTWQSGTMAITKVAVRRIREARPGWTVYSDGCPGSENAWQVSDRADRLIARLLALSGDIALFSHEQFSCSFAARWIGLPSAQSQHLVFGTAAMGVLGFNPSHPEIRSSSTGTSGPGIREKSRSPLSAHYASARRSRSVTRLRSGCSHLGSTDREHAALRDQPAGR